MQLKLFAKRLFIVHSGARKTFAFVVENAGNGAINNVLGRVAQLGLYVIFLLPVKS